MQSAPKNSATEKFEKMKRALEAAQDVGYTRLSLDKTIPKDDCRMSVSLRLIMLIRAKDELFDEDLASIAEDARETMRRIYEDQIIPVVRLFDTQRMSWKYVYMPE